MSLPEEATEAHPVPAEVLNANEQTADDEQVVTGTVHRGDRARGRDQGQ